VRVSCEGFGTEIESSLVGQVRAGEGGMRTGSSWGKDKHTMGGRCKRGWGTH
jgi:hypothetical protein